MRDKILIVDDATVSRELLAEIFEDTYEIIQTKNGREALDVITMRKEGLACILLDLMMPGMNGYELLEILNERGWTKDVPVIVVSGDFSNESVNRCKALGALDFISKPINLYDVRAKIDNIIEKND